MSVQRASASQTDRSEQQDDFLPSFDMDAIVRRRSGSGEGDPADEDDEKQQQQQQETNGSASPGKKKRSSSWRSLARKISRNKDKMMESAKKWYASSWKALKASFVSEETEAACRRIWGLLVGLYQDLTPLDAATGLLLLSSYYSSFPKRVPDESRLLTDVELVRRATDLMRHATASYGWKATCGFMAHVMETRTGVGAASTLAPVLNLDDDASNVEALCKYTGVSEGEVIEARWTSKPFSPGHYVVVDSRLGAVVVSIRGTWGVKDSVTDLLATSKPWSYRGIEGHVHEGILLCATKKLEELETALERASVGCGGEQCKVVITGHSLGGGTATIMALMLADSHPKWAVECWAFAPAPAMTRSLAESPAVREIVKSFVFRDDAVPRLSYGSADLLKKTMMMLLSQSSGTTQRIFQWFASGNVLGDTVTKYVESKLGVKAEVDVERALAEARAQRGDETTFMFPAGRVFHLSPQQEAPTSTLSVVAGTPAASPAPDTSPAPAVTPRKSKFHAGQLGYEVHEIGDLAFFDELVVSGNMFLDHLPHKYEFALCGVEEGLTGIRRYSEDQDETSSKAWRKASQTHEESEPAPPVPPPRPPKRTDKTHTD